MSVNVLHDAVVGRVDQSDVVSSDNDAGGLFVTRPQRKIQHVYQDD